MSIVQRGKLAALTPVVAVPPADVPPVVVAPDVPPTSNPLVDALVALAKSHAAGDDVIAHILAIANQQAGTITPGAGGAVTDFSHAGVVDALTSSLKGAQTLIDDLVGPLARIEITAHFSTRVVVAADAPGGLPPFVVEESATAWANADGTHEVTPGTPHYSVDNGDVPSLAKAAAELVKTVKQVQANQS